MNGGHEGKHAIVISSGRETKFTNRGGHIDGERDSVPPAPGTGDISHTCERSTCANPYLETGKIILPAQRPCNNED